MVWFDEVVLISAGYFSFIVMRHDMLQSLEKHTLIQWLQNYSFLQNSLAILTHLVSYRCLTVLILFQDLTKINPCHK